MSILYKLDGDKICATFDDFINIQESPVGFGDTKEQALLELEKAWHFEKGKQYMINKVNNFDFTELKDDFFSWRNGDMSDFELNEKAREKILTPNNK